MPGAAGSQRGLRRPKLLAFGAACGVAAAAVALGTAFAPLPKTGSAFDLAESAGALDQGWGSPRACGLQGKVRGDDARARRPSWRCARRWTTSRSF